MYQPFGNNWSPMLVEIKAKNLCLIVPGSFKDFQKDSLGLLLDAVY